MREGWEEMTLGDISVKMTDGPFGSNLKSEHYTAERQVRIIQLSNIGEEGWREDNVKYTTFDHLETISRSEVFPNDIVIAKMMPAGRAIICPSHEQKFVLSSDAVKVELKKGFDCHFVNYSINSPYFRAQVYENVSGSGRVRTSLTKLRACYLRIPPLSEQQEIVDYLDSAFAKIDAMKANAAKALEEGKALFQSALKQLLEPKEGWEKDKLINVYNFIDYRGATPNKINEGVPLITAKNVKYGYIDYTIKDYISEQEYAQRQSRGISRRGDLLFTTEAPLGNIAIADIDRFSAGQRLITFQKYDSSKYEIDNKFFYFYMLGPTFQKKIKDLATGATALGIKAKLLKEVLVPIPSFPEQQTIVATLDSIKSKVDQLQENYDKIAKECDTLKQAILRQVFE